MTEDRCTCGRPMEPEREVSLGSEAATYWHRKFHGLLSNYQLLERQMDLMATSSKIYGMDREALLDCMAFVRWCLNPTGAFMNDRLDHAINVIDAVRARAKALNEKLDGDT